MPTYARADVRFVAGTASSLFDDERNEYLDLLGGIAVASVGHCHPAVVSAIEEQARKLIHASNLFLTEPQERLAQRLASLTGGMSSFFCNSGAEAVECALKIARRWSEERGIERGRIVAARGGFHGRTFGALSATGQPAKKEPFEPLLPNFDHVPFGDAAALDAAVGPHVPAVILEPIQGEAGVVVPPPGYLTAARDICDRAGALLIWDEVQTGLGRTGRWFGFQHFGVEADVVTVAKALGNGVPVGACWARDQVADTFAVGDHGSTFGGQPLAASAARAVLRTMEEADVPRRAEAAGARLADGLASMTGVRGVRGLGLLLAAEVGEGRAREVAAAALDRGLVVNAVTDSAVRLSPPLLVSDEEVDEALAILAQAVAT